MREIDLYFLEKQEPTKSCLLFLREFITDHHTNITEAWKYKAPFYCYKGKNLCYLWTNKITGHPYIGIVDGYKMDHPLLISEKRSQIKIMMIDPLHDVPVAAMREILNNAIWLKK